MNPKSIFLTKAILAYRQTVNRKANSLGKQKLTDATSAASIKGIAEQAGKCNHQLMCLCTHFSSFINNLAASFKLVIFAFIRIESCSSTPVYLWRCDTTENKLTGQEKSSRTIYTRTILRKLILN